MKVVLVAVAGAAGALSRYGIGAVVGVRSFPWATLGINVAGSYLLGLVVVLGDARGSPETATVPVAVGFLGAFTTFSTFSYETYALARNDRAGTAVAYLAISVIGGLVGAAAGYATAKAMT